MPRTLTAALHREEDWYIAQCLEVDVASQGHTIDEALAHLGHAVYRNREGRVAVLPLHGVVKRSTLASTLRQAGLTPAEFLKLLD